MKKFSEMEYVRPDTEQAKKELVALTEQLKKAETYEEARAAFLEMDKGNRHVMTASTIAQIRHDINTKDAFYDGESKFWDSEMPKLQEAMMPFVMAMLESRFRPQFEEEFGDLYFRNAEIQLKSFSPAIVEDMMEENRLTSEYEDLLASAQVPFEGKTYTLSQMTPFKNDADDARRLAAWQAEGQWYKDHQEQLDSIYDSLVHLRDRMGRKLGYDGYTELGY